MNQVLLDADIRDRSPVTTTTVEQGMEDERPPAEAREPVNILIVDDHQENRLAIEASLQGMSSSLQSVHLVHASSGREALRKVLEGDYAVILLDVRMPGLDGYETAALIRERPQSQHTPIIFLTALNTSSENVSKGYRLGAVDYLFKPYQPEILRAKVSVFVELHRKRLEVLRMAERIEKQTAMLRASNGELTRANSIMRELSRELEHRVRVRTQELQNSNLALEKEVEERRRAEVEIRKAKEMAETANGVKDQFLAVLSHELRTPLAPVLAIAQMLREDPETPETQKGWIETIARNIQLEARLIDDLLDLTRIANGKLRLNLELVDAQKLLRDTIPICAEEIERKKLRLELALSAQDALINADPTRLQQAFWNVLKNAVKFTPEHGHIIIRTYNTPEGAFCCEVRDSGIGIPPERIDQVFNAFEQADSNITRRFGGLGLGLAITRELVQRHGGTISAQSDGGGTGAVFKIQLPTMVQTIAEAAEPKDLVPVPHASKQLPAWDSAESSGCELPLTNGQQRLAKSVEGNEAGTHILLVEDNEDTRQAIQILLERRGHRVRVANSVSTALELLATFPCDIVISDIGLPDGTGIELIQKIKAIRPVHAIAVSGFGMEEDVRRSRAAGFDAHLTKPVNFDQLMQILDQLLALPAFASHAE